MSITEYKNIHLIGIGGIGMSAIAQLLLKSGVKVTGSDLKDNRMINQLRRLGATVYIGHNAQNLNTADLVVYSSAISEDNPEMKESRKKKIKIIKRAEALAELMQSKTVITVAGAHGKTTTTSMIACLLIEAGLNPTVAVGGVVRNLENNACAGEGKFFVAEADESDGSFLSYQPDYSVITNIDYEHLDYYKDWESIVAAFEKFIHRTKKDGCVFCCGDDINLKTILKNYKSRNMLFSLTQESDVYARNIKLNGWTSEFECVFKGKSLGKFNLSLAGMHNISNCLAVIAIGLELGIDVKIIKSVLSTYKGAQRRLQVKFDQNNILLVDDYAHHPTEIRATLSAIKNLNSQRIIAIFQPHRYSRTKHLLNEFGCSFDLADYAIITDIYAASEKPIDDVSAKNISDKIRQNGHKEVHYLPKDEIIQRVLEIVRPQDLVITLGAGDITKVADELAEKFKGQD